LKLARWIGEYYCCAPETALKSVLPEAIRKEKDGWKKQLFVRALHLSGEFPKLPKRQQDVWNIIEERREILLAELLELAETTAATVRKLEDRGLVEITSEISERDPYARETILPTQSIVLNSAQDKALGEITKAMNAENSSRTFLLHGVTGSGKTEIYLQALAHALEQGKGAIVLVPEISLTPQTVERFKARFSSGKLQTLVAVLHSHLSAGERHDEWHKIRQGRARIVIGARSAIFAPVEPLGLIIVDEEHETTYKQEEAPRYHARDVAIMRGQMENAVVVLGSATPSLESFYNCKRGKFTLLELPERVDNQKMPHVRVVDMRQAAHKEKGTPLFSPQLKEAIINGWIARRADDFIFEPARLFDVAAMSEVRLRGECPNCSLALTFHRQEQKLACHICGHVEKVPLVCPNEKCKNPAIRFSGTGTQKVEETLAKLFPKARIQRMDADTMKRKDDYRRVLGDFRAGKTDILVGTQMIAKGLHFPNVTLVGIIYADLALHQPDFRAGERTFPAAHASRRPRRSRRRGGRGVCAGVRAVSSGDPIRAPPRFHRFLRTGDRISRTTEISARQPRRAAHAQKSQRGEGEIFRRPSETRTGKKSEKAGQGRQSSARR
jgi:primosomal protein N' (replication factor Y)